MLNTLKKDMAIDVMLMIGTIGATFIFGLFALPHVTLMPGILP